MFLTLALIVSLSISGFGCSSGYYEINSKLQTGKWQLEKLNGAAITLADTRQVTLEINAESSSAAGQAPCNRYSCSYDQDNEKIKFGTITSTKMACDDLGKESEYYSMLKDATKFIITGDKLTLFNGSKAVAEFIKIK